MWLYKNAKDPFRFTAKQEALLKANREEFRYTSGLEDNLMDVLENKFKEQDFISNRDLSFALFKDYDALSRNNKQTREIRYYMEHEGYAVGASKLINGKRIQEIITVIKCNFIKKVVSMQTKISLKSGTELIINNQTVQEIQQLIKVGGNKFAVINLWMLPL